MRVRLTDAQIQAVVDSLKNTSDEQLGSAIRRATSLDITQVDDTSIQTIETLVFFCVGRDTWDLIENLGSGGVCCAGCDEVWRGGPTAWATPEEIYGLQELI